MSADPRLLSEAELERIRDYAAEVERLPALRKAVSDPENPRRDLAVAAYNHALYCLGELARAETAQKLLSHIEALGAERDEAKRKLSTIGRHFPAAALFVGL
jgi:HEAT repeat protein